MEADVISGYRAREVWNRERSLIKQGSGFTTTRLEGGNGLRDSRKLRGTKEKA